MRKWIIITVILAGSFITQQTLAAPYGVGVYNDCAYSDDCYISIATSEEVLLSVTPIAAGIYTIAKDEVTVSTNVSTGYELSMWSTDSDSVSSLEMIGSPSNKIPSTGALPSSPTTLPMNTWGYRIDNIDNFGSGPTSAVENQMSSDLTFANIPTDTAPSPEPIKTTATSAPTGDTTTLWYGIRVDLEKPSGIYTTTLRYSVTAAL